MTERIEANNYSFRKNISKEEIPSTIYLTHGLYSYPAKFIPHVPYFVIKNFLKGTNNIIIDPFAGSSTTAIESIKSGNNCIVLDNNPILDLLSKTKTMVVDFELVDDGKMTNLLIYKKDGNINKNGNSKLANLERIDLDAIIEKMKKNENLFLPNWSNLDHWVEPEFKQILAKIWGFIHNETKDMKESVKALLTLSALNVTKKYSNGALDVPKLYKSKLRKKQVQELKEKYEENKEMPYDLLRQTAYRYYKKMKEFTEILKESDLKVKYYDKDSIDGFSFEELKKNEKFVLSLGDTDSINFKLPDIFKNKVDLLITSPPYAYAQEYIRSSKMDMFWLDLIDEKKVRELTRSEIGHRKGNNLEEILEVLNKFDLLKDTLVNLSEIEKERFGKEKKYTRQIIHYFYDMYLIIKNMRDVLKDKGIFAFFVGNPTVLGYKLPCCEIFIDYFRGLGYTIKEYGYDPIVSRSLLRKRNNASPNGMNFEWLIIAENNVKKG